ncbi:Pex2 / Pex12 amino terminal region [Oesophagostomum dentatum]|uniref:Peroxisome assembly protein 12 n=2 Tax=Oesophagostomum dentatum TaxID=61180 RepID=A0A0B1SVT1_OESDE|nr:Pex2 / Pex12 amino terminal region [Oesophagostomum dentatum]
MASTLRASHLTSFQHAIGDQPSIFDILSQESLMTALKPAMGHVLKFLSIMYSHRFQTAYRCYDELYLLFDLLLQNQYLKKYGASFSENFYGMKRVYNATGAPPLEFNSRIRSLMVLDLRIRLARLFVRFWPMLKSLLTFATTVLQLLYIINRSTVHSPYLWLAGVRLEKLTAQDIEAFERIPMHLQSSGILNRLWRFFLSLPGIFSRLFGYGLFFVQFIDFMYNSDLGSQLTRKNLRGQVPPAPHKLLTESSVLMLDTNKCPLCMRKRTNDTALSVSGYVFCYSCIHDHVSQFKTCPVTGLPATLNELIRLYIH